MYKLGFRQSVFGQEKTVTPGARVARWLILRPKIPILEGLGMENVGIFTPFGIIFDHLV
jgi:hypothetical protein